MTDKPASHRPPLLRARGPFTRILPLAVLALSLAVTADLWRNDQRNAERAMRADFEFHVNEAIGLIEHRIHAYEQVLRGAQGLLSSSPDIGQDEFATYVETLQLPRTHPGIQGLMYIRAEPPGARARYAARMRKEAGPEFDLPDSDAAHAPVTYRATVLDGSVPAQGANLYADPVHSTAMEHAAGHGTVAITGKIPLADAAGRHTGPGFAMYIPVYRAGRNDPAGWIGAPVRIAGMMAPLPTEAGIEIDIELYDGDTITGPMLMFDVDNWPQHANPETGAYRSVARLGVPNRRWTVAARSMPAFEARLDKSGNIKAAFGAGVGVLLAFITWQLAGSRARALEAARAMTRELYERERRYRRMFEDSASIAFLLDPGSGRIADANAAAAAFWGYPPGRLRRMSIEEIDVSLQASALTLCRRDATRSATRMESRHRLADGSVRDVEIYAGPLHHQNKTLVYCILHDITARKQAETALRASEERYRLIADNTGDVIWMMDAGTLQFTYVSPSIQRQRGYTAEEIMALHRDVTRAPPALPLDNGMPQMARQLHDRIRRFLNGDESRRREVKEIDQPHKDGRVVPVEVVSTLLCDEYGIPRAVIGVSRDISARRQAQEEQKRFVAMVSHEFRTPLATIDGAVQRLLSTSTKADDATRKRLEKIEKSADRLTALLDDYLTQERFDTAGRGLHLSRMSPRALLEDCAASARALSADHAIDIDASLLPASVACDADRLRLTLRILADNAVKYTPAGSRILVAGRIAPQGGIEFTVADDGDGIPETEIAHIFDKFFRGRAASTQPGSGLGLHLARSVVEMHGGSLTVHSQAGQGARFTIWLPLDLEQAAGAINAAA